jgi:uncharacterized Ntn-hydrolase superfamily protein
MSRKYRFRVRGTGMNRMIALILVAWIGAPVPTANPQSPVSRAFERAKGDLAERMLAALDAAQQVGGDICGRQSAALIVVKGTSSGKPWSDRIFDLRVDDSAEPLKELRRLETFRRSHA